MAVDSGGRKTSDPLGISGTFRGGLWTFLDCRLDEFKTISPRFYRTKRSVPDIWATSLMSK